MKEATQGAGVKHWHGDYFLELQSEALEPLQEAFEQFGSFVISGCEVTANGGNWDIAAGIAAIRHADGFKIVRVGAVTDKSLPAYYVCGKETLNGNYGTGSAARGYHYFADSTTFTEGAASVDDTKLIFDVPDSAGSLNDIFSAIGKKSLVSTTRTTTEFTTGQTISFKLNRVSRLLHISATLTIDNYTSYAGAYRVGLYTSALPEFMRPNATKQYFTAHVDPLTSSNFGQTDPYNKDWIRHIEGYIGDDGIVYLQWLPTSTNSPYVVRINATIPLD